MVAMAALRDIAAFKAPGLARLRLTPARREAFAFYLFAAPWLIGLLVFTLGPMVASFLLGFTSYDIITPARWIGLANYQTLFTNDPFIWQALKVTFTYSLVAVPLGLVASFLLAVLLNQKVRGIYLYRTLFYLPSILPAVPVALLWLWIFNPSFGLLNNALATIGIQGPQWLFDEFWVLPALIVMSLWSVGGAMVIYLAGLQGIPQHLYEAVEVDGGGWWVRFRSVTLPMMSPIIFFNLVLGIIGSLQTFTQAYVMTQGGPNNASLFYGLYLYRNAFEYFKMGYASALAWVLFAIILLLTLLVFRSSPLWVYYESQSQGGA
jgi:multiple sugar transport system permease protein